MIVFLLVGTLLFVGVALDWPVAEKLHVSNDAAFLGGILFMGVGLILSGIEDLKQAVALR